MGISRREQFVADALGSESDNCVVWPFAVRKSSGYPAHSLSRIKGKKNVDAHRYVCELAHGAAVNGMQAAHKCGNKLCVNPHHLYWATPLENLADAKRHGKLRGGGRYRQKLFAGEIERICTSGESLIRLADVFNTTASYIGRLRRKYSAQQVI